MCVLCGDHEAVHLTAADTGGSTTAATQPVVSLDQAIYQLTTQWSGTSEGTTRTWAGSTVYYAMPDTAPNYSTTEASGFRPMSPVMKDAARTAFELWDDLVAINLVESASATSQITFAYSSTTSGGGTYAQSWISGWGPNYSLTRGRIWLNSSWQSHDTDADMVFGNYSYITYIHEIGHALGLSHPGTYNGSADFATDAEYFQDTRQYSVMSYFDADENGSGVDHYGADGKWKYASTPMLHDVAAIQAKYGADMTTRTGDTTYGFNFTADKSVFNFLVNKDPIICIWDAGGNDTLDASGYTTNQRIDLRDGTYSDIGHMTQNVAIAYGALIENGYGGSGADSITGNDIANILMGNGGADTLSGGKGNDTIDGGPGNDLIQFASGDGHDTVNGFVAGGTDDRLEITGFTSAVLQQEGADTRVVLDASNSILLKNVQAVAVTAADLNIGFTVSGGTTPPPSTTLIGTNFSDTLNGTAAAETISGLAGNDTINAGDGADTIAGGTGNDTLNGGAGNDLFKFAAGDGVDTITGFVAGGTDDRIEVTGFASYTLVQEGVDLRVVLDASNSILLKNVSASAFTAADINLPMAAVTPPPTTPPPSTGGINGTSGNDTLYGTDAGDTVNGLAGSDLLYGQGGDDFLYGGDGTDTLRGNTGLDTLDGGAGNDILVGGMGADTFAFTGAGFGADRIQDFANGTEKIKFSGISGVDDFSDLSISNVGGAAVITLPDGSSVTLSNITASQLDASDFLFGP